MILMIDNYDSFTYNLVHYLAELGEEVVVHRNDKLELEDIGKLNPDMLVVSPGHVGCIPRSMYSQRGGNLGRGNKEICGAYADTRSLPGSSISSIRLWRKNSES